MIDLKKIEKQGMNNYKIRLTTQSDTLFAAAEGSAAVDSTTQYDQYGFPFLPAKTFKGLLKESAIEVQEILGKEWNIDNSIIHNLFGQEGVGNSGRLDFGNGVLEDVASYKESTMKYDVKPQEVLDYFTHIRYQTAMENGVAKEGSLRSSRVIKPDLTFEIKLAGELEKGHLELLQKACQNLRHVGTNRNRGFGKVEVVWMGEINSENSNQTGDLTGKTFKITLKSPALLPSRAGDANTVSSEKVISGRKILGMLASAYLKGGNDKNKAHTDESFKKLFLDGSVQFSNAYPVSKEGQVCFPLGQHWVTTKTKEVVELDYDEDKPSENYSAINGYYSYEGGSSASVSTVLDFHNSRNKVNQDWDHKHTRIKGSNSGDGIYYYEKLAEGQSFVFQVDGEEEQLDKIRGLLENSSLRLGKASSTHLGRVKINTWDGTWPSEEMKVGEECILTFTSPLLIRNDNGVYDASLNTLKNYLEGGDIEDSRIRATRVQVFQGKINMQLPEMLAIAPGSSLKVRVTDKNIGTIKSGRLGEFQHEGYGQFVVKKKYEGKKGSLKNTLHNDDATKNDNRPNLKFDVIEKDNSIKLLRHIAIQREIAKAQKAALDKAKGGAHKNTIMQMLQLCKSIKMEMQGGKNFDSAIDSALDGDLKTQIYPSKVLENIGHIIGEHSAIINKRKENKNDASLKEKVKIWIIKGLTGKKGKDTFNSNEAKIAFWTTYFNQLKINNRG
jgi:CRISPR-associated protein Csx10